MKMMMSRVEKNRESNERGKEKGCSAFICHQYSVKQLSILVNYGWLPMTVSKDNCLPLTNSSIPFILFIIIAANAIIILVIIWFQLFNIFSSYIHQIVADKSAVCCSVLEKHLDTALRQIRARISPQLSHCGFLSNKNILKRKVFLNNQREGREG